MKKSTAEARATYLTEQHGSDTLKFDVVRLGDLDSYYAENNEEYCVVQRTRNSVTVVEVAD